MKHIKILSLVLAMLTLLALGALAMAEEVTSLDCVLTTYELEAGYNPSCIVSVGLNGNTLPLTLKRVSWTDTVYQESFNVDTFTLLQRGVTMWYYGESNYLDVNNNRGVYRALLIDLPDDPSIAGDQFIEVIAEGKTYRVEMKLSYLGSYAQSLGWDVQFGDKWNVVDDDNATLRTGESEALFSDIEVDVWEVDFYLDVIPSFEMEIKIHDCRVEPVFESVSWTDNVEFWTIEEYYDNNALSAAMQGRTICMPAGYTYEDNRPTTTYSAQVYLPDDPSIAGPQTVTLMLGGQRVTVAVDLIYMGSYKNNAGWVANYNGMTVEEVGVTDASQLVDMSGYETYDAYVYAMTYEDYPTLSRNKSGQEVNYCLSIMLGETMLYVDSVSLSWGTAEPSAFKSGDVSAWFESWMLTWEAVKQGRTVYEFSFGDKLTGVDIYLPNDPSIEGWQTIGLNLSNGEQVAYYVNLVWHGDYDTGTGWDIRDQRIITN